MCPHPRSYTGIKVLKNIEKWTSSNVAEGLHEGRRISVFRVPAAMAFNNSLTVSMSATQSSSVAGLFGSAGASIASGSGEAGAAGLADGFAQLLARLLGQTPQAAQPASSPASTQASVPQVPGSVANVIEVIETALTGESAPTETSAADALTAPNAQLPQQLATLIGKLDDLSAILEAGSEPTEADVEDIIDLLDEVAAAMGLDPASLVPMPREQLALGLPAGAPVSPLGAAIIDTLKSALPSADIEADSPQMEQMAGKLRALIGALSNGDVAPKTLPTPDELARALASVRSELGSAALARAQAGLGANVAAGAAATPVATAEAQGDPRLTAIVAAGGSGSTTETAATAEPSNAATATTERSASTPRADTQPQRERDPQTARPTPTAAPQQQTQPVDPTTTPDGQASIEARSVGELPPAARVPSVQGYQTNQQQLNLPQLAFELVRQVQHGNTQFQIRLDPPELGRIDVRMDIDSQGNVLARLTVDKVETLDLMQRDQRALERALAQAGLDANKTSLEFSLRQNMSQRQDRDQPQQTNPVFGDGDSGIDAIAEQPSVTLYRGTHTARGLNLIV
jgi:flagellar hook-length control protein FliK